MKRALLLACLLVLGSVAFADTAFADSLFAHKEYYRAITEYQRCWFMGIEKEYCHNRIIESYLSGEDYEGLIDYLEGSKDLVDHLYYTQAQLKNQRPDLAAIVNDDPSDPCKIALYGFSKAYLGDFGDAENRLKNLGQPEYQALQRMLVDINNQTRDKSYLSPTLAGALGLVPGLGYAYGGAWQTAASALVTNALLWGVGFELGKKELYFSSGAVAVAGMGFYLGSIYGSVSHAAKRNRDTRRRYLDSFSDEIFKELREIAVTR